MRFGSSVSLLVVLTILSCTASCEAASGKERMLVLTQTNNLFGNMTAYVKSDGAKVESADHKKSFLCIAPKWDVLMFNNQRKLIYRCPYATWSKSGFKTALSFADTDALGGVLPVAVQKLQYVGLSATNFALPNEHNGVRSMRFGKEADYLTTESFPTQLNVRKFLLALNNAPLQCTGLILRFRRLATHGFGFGLEYNKQVFVQTILDTKKSAYMPVDYKLFVEPSNYKPVSDADVLFDKVDLESVYDVMGK
jgi:hypothetical protein